MVVKAANTSFSTMTTLLYSFNKVKRCSHNSLKEIEFTAGTIQIECYKKVTMGRQKSAVTFNTAFGGGANGVDSPVNELR